MNTNLIEIELKETQKKIRHFIKALAKATGHDKDSIKKELLNLEIEIENLELDLIKSRF